MLRCTNILFIRSAILAPLSTTNSRASSPPTRSPQTFNTAPFPTTTSVSLAKTSSVALAMRWLPKPELLTVSRAVKTSNRQLTLRPRNRQARSRKPRRPPPFPAPLQLTPPKKWKPTWRRSARLLPVPRVFWNGARLWLRWLAVLGSLLRFNEMADRVLW